MNSMPQSSAVSMAGSDNTTATKKKRQRKPRNKNKSPENGNCGKNSMTYAMKFLHMAESIDSINDTAVVGGYVENNNQKQQNQQNQQKQQKQQKGQTEKQKQDENEYRDRKNKERELTRQILDILAVNGSDEVKKMHDDLSALRVIDDTQTKGMASQPGHGRRHRKAEEHDLEQQIVLALAKAGGHEDLHAQLMALRDTDLAFIAEKDAEKDARIKSAADKAGLKAINKAASEEPAGPASPEGGAVVEVEGVPDDSKSCIIADTGSECGTSDSD
jgi:hypothetical protein